MRIPILAAVTALAFTVAAGTAHSAARSVPVIRVSGNHFVDDQGTVVQLRGVNVAGLEFVAAQGWSPKSPWGGQTGDALPDWTQMKSWKINAVRIPLNEASWLGYPCADATGATRNPDPGHNYQDTVKQAVARASDAGFYVILDLHWSAPRHFCPLAQNAMADQDNSIQFWTQIAQQFQTQSNVLFELFNEPFFWWLSAGETDWGVLRDGGTITQYVTGDAGKYQVALDWKAAGMQAMLNAVRATGATNIVLVGAPSWCQDLSKWVAYRPKDPLSQLGAVWHAYPNSATPGDPKAAEPKFGDVAYRWVQSVLDAGYPVVISEFGDHNSPGTRGAPFVSRLLPWADQAGASYLGWAWDAWQNADNVLIKESSGTPTDGYGAYVKEHLTCIADGRTGCRPSSR